MFLDHIDFFFFLSMRRYPPRVLSDERATMRASRRCHTYLRFSFFPQRSHAIDVIHFRKILFFFFCMIINDEHQSQDAILLSACVPIVTARMTRIEVQQTGAQRAIESGLRGSFPALYHHRYCMRRTGRPAAKHQRAEIFE